MASAAPFSDAMDDVEYVRLVKDRVFGFKIPAGSGGASGYVASTWKEHQIWVGELKVVSRGRECRVVLTTKSSGKVFAVCPIRQGGPQAVEKASDSSRYFALRIEDPKSGRHMWLGIGFSQRSDAFDFSVALQEHDKDVEAADKPAKMDLGAAADIELGGLGDGTRIKLSLKKGAKSGAKRREPRAGTAKFDLKKPSGGLGPPPGAARARGPQRSTHAQEDDILGGLGTGVASMSIGGAPAPAPAPAAAAEDDFFGGAPAPVPAPAPAPVDDFFGGTPAPAPAPAPRPADDDWGF